MSLTLKPLIYLIVTYRFFIKTFEDYITKLTNYWYPGTLNSPHIICFSEHHLRNDQLHHLYINKYKLVANCCRSFHKRGGVCIFIQEFFSYSTIDLNEFCHECIIEACAMKLDSHSLNVCVLVIYRSLSGDFVQFLHLLD